MSIEPIDALVEREEWMDTRYSYSCGRCNIGIGFITGNMVCTVTVDYKPCFTNLFWIRYKITYRGVRCPPPRIIKYLAYEDDHCDEWKEGPEKNYSTTSLAYPISCYRSESGVTTYEVREAIQGAEAKIREEFGQGARIRRYIR
jgi:hypothetical protein